MRSSEVQRVLKVLEGFEDTINAIQMQDVPVKECCRAASKSVAGWGVVIHELNDVVSVLGPEPDNAFDDGYMKACKKALEIIQRAIGGVRC